MDFPLLVVKNLLNLPLLSFLCGVIVSLFQQNFRIPKQLTEVVTIYILFCVGLKGGAPLVEHSAPSALLFSVILGSLLIWGFLHPVISFYLLRSFTSTDPITAAAIAACFGSVSIMTFITALSFLDHMEVGYQKLLIGILAIMEIPAIISGLLIAKIATPLEPITPLKIMVILKESFYNKPIIAIFSGLLVGIIFHYTNQTQISHSILFLFSPLLSLFLLSMGLRVGVQKNYFLSFPRSLHFFGIYMPLISGGCGLLLSYLLALDVGTATLIAVLTASASYIAVPAAMKIALPEAKEGIYLPLSIGIAFPFNVLIGIPLYYYLAIWLLG